MSLDGHPRPYRLAALAGGASLDAVLARVHRMAGGCSGSEAQVGASEKDASGWTPESDVWISASIRVVACSRIRSGYNTPPADTPLEPLIGGKKIYS